MNGRSAERLEVGLSNLRFDYNSVPSSLAKFLSGQADRIRRQCVTSIIQIGKALLEAKHHLSHGAFIRWVEGEVCIPVRSAQAYMRVASWASNKSATVAHLPPSVLYLLSASSTPPEFVADVLKRAEAGEYIVPSVMREELKTARAREQQESREQDSKQQQERRTPQELREQQESRRAESPFASQASHKASKWGPVVIESETSAGVNELFTILVRGLSAADFERVRDIVTSDAVLSDPRLAENLKRAFLDSGRSDARRKLALA
jgi:hypothetical protein